MSDENQARPKWRFNWKLAVVAWLLFAGHFFLPILNGADGTPIYSWQVILSIGGVVHDIRSLISDPLSHFSRRTRYMFLDEIALYQLFILCCMSMLMVCAPIILFRSKSYLQRYLLSFALFTFGLSLCFVVSAFIAHLAVFNIGYWMLMASYGLFALSLREKRALTAHRPPQDL
jgi:hypothetical protein